MKIRIFTRQTAVVLTVLLLMQNFAAFAQTNKRVAPKRAAQTSAATAQTADGRSAAFVANASNSAMAAMWQSGALPQPLPLPQGNTDEVAAVLAKKVAAKNAESVPALLTALQVSGFFITDKNGQVALAPPDGKGQGLAVNGWEVASMAKMLGDERGVSLAELDKSLQSVPLLDQLPKKNHNIGALLVEGIRANAANTRNGFLRIWARFIIELGKNSAKKYDIQTTTSAAEIELDPIQHFLIMRRLYGDLWAQAEKFKVQSSKLKAGMKRVSSKHLSCAILIIKSQKPILIQQTLNLEL